MEKLRLLAKPDSGATFLAKSGSSSGTRSLSDREGGEDHSVMAGTIFAICATAIAVTWLCSKGKKEIDDEYKRVA